MEHHGRARKHRKRELVNMFRQLRYSIQLGKI